MTEKATLSATGRDSVFVSGFDVSSDEREQIVEYLVDRGVDLREIDEHTRVGTAERTDTGYISVSVEEAIQ